MTHVLVSFDGGGFANVEIVLPKRESVGAVEAFIVPVTET